MRSGAPDARDIFEGVSADDFDGMRRVVTTVRPDAIVNCIGLVKQLDEAKDAVGSIIVNSVLPHRLGTGFVRVRRDHVVGRHAPRAQSHRHPFGATLSAD